jgi:hypothetical protein
MTSLQCAVAGHAPDSNPVYNSGYYFVACRRCGLTLIRCASGNWRNVPSGHRVVWKSGRHSHSLEADYSGVLPIVQETASLPALRSPYVSWSRALIRFKPGGARRAAAAAPIEEETDDYRYPGLLLAAVLFGAGLKMLLGFTSTR